VTAPGPAISSSSSGYCSALLWGEVLVLRPSKFPDKFYVGAVRRRLTQAALDHELMPAIVKINDLLTRYPLEEWAASERPRIHKPFGHL